MNVCLQRARNCNSAPRSSHLPHEQSEGENEEWKNVQTLLNQRTTRFKLATQLLIPWTLGPFLLINRTDTDVYFHLSYVFLSLQSHLSNVIHFSSTNIRFSLFIVGVLMCRCQSIIQSKMNTLALSLSSNYNAELSAESLVPATKMLLLFVLGSHSWLCKALGQTLISDHPCVWLMQQLPLWHILQTPSGSKQACCLPFRSLTFAFCMHTKESNPGTYPCFKVCSSHSSFPSHKPL